MKESERNRVDEMLDLLAEEVAERLRARSWLDSEARAGGPAEADRPVGPAAERVTAEEPAPESEEPEPVPEEEGAIVPGAREAGDEGVGEAEGEAEISLDGKSAATPEEVGPEVDMGLGPGLEPGTPASAPVPSHTARLLGRMALGLLVLLVVINIPFNRHGTTLATAMPDNRALVIRSGLVVKEEDDPEIYVHEDGQFRWISSLDAFEYRGYTWEDVHIVEDGFLEDYAMGPPIHVLVKCNGSPHIYRVEGEKKRWIVDIEAFEAAGHVWEDVQFVSCAYIRSLPNGETIPPGHGRPPEP
jgi:hypothetical protein